jgi:protein-S-isoprenylcysteine O-methyltransferase Ste14
MYSSMLLLFVAMPMAVGSGWGLVSSLALSALIILRTALEDRTLANELEGYATYRSKVRYRLIPQIW